MRKLLSMAVAAGVIFSTTLSPAALADVAATALPTLSSATNATVTTSNADMNVQITGGQNSVGTLNWSTYNIGSDASVNYEFTAHNQTALNKVAASGGLSQIYGKITDSGCSGCGYESTGKIILINPNGVLFGDGANVNVNSFTVSTLDGTYDSSNNQLKLEKTSDQSDAGIMVLEGAEIYGDKGVTFASNNITQYAGSKISTSTAANVRNDSYGKVKLVTSDGVNFTYYNNGAVKGISDVTTSSDKMILSVNGDITSGNIDLRNYSTNSDSEVNLLGATLKATKAVSGNDGNIWLTASNKIVVEDSTFITENADGAENVTGGNVVFLSGQKTSVGSSTIDAVGDVKITSQGDDIVVDATTITTPKDVKLTADGIASFQNGSVVNGKNINVTGTERAQAVSSTLTADNDVNIISAGDLAWTSSAKITAGNDVNVTASNGYLLMNDSIVKAGNDVNLTSNDTISSSKLSGSTFTAANDVNLESTANSVILTGTEQFVPSDLLNIKAAKNAEISKASDLTTSNVTFTAGENVVLASTSGSVNVEDTTKFLAADKIYIQGAKDVKTTGTVDLNGIKTYITAGNDVDATLTNVDNRENGLVAKAGNDMTVTTAGTLSVSSLISGNDMTINANKVIAGKELTTNYLETAGDSNDRAYIEVGGEFTSNVTNDNYEVTASADLTDDGNYYNRHHIQYGEDEKILLVNKRPVDNNVTDATVPDNDNGADRDVVNPGDIPDDDASTNIDTGDTGSGSGTGSDTGDTGSGTGSDTDTGSTGSGSDDDTSCDGDAALDDTATGEDTPSLVSSLSSLLNYTASATSD